jgi:hypothetical protein
MARQPHCKKWWSSPEEARLALDELQIALDKHENSKDYHKKLNESVIKRVDEIDSNENFQKIITGIFIPPAVIDENLNKLDDLAKLLEEYDEKHDISACKNKQPIIDKP